MKPATAAFCTLLLLTGSASAQTKDPAGVPVNAQPSTQQAQPSDLPKRPGTATIDTGGLRDQLLQGAINTILRPRRPRPPPPQQPAPPMIAIPDPAPPMILEPGPSTPAPAAVQVDPIRPRPAITPKVVPAAQPAPQPAAVRPPSPPLAAEPVTPEPVPELPVDTAPVVVAAPEIAPPPAPVAAAPTPILAPQPAVSAGLGLVIALVAAAIAAATAYARRSRQIARTRAALSLHPSLDLMAGSCSSSGLVLAGPSLAIRARLDGENRNA